MPANKYALLRYRIIDKCIRNKYRPHPSKEELRQACEEALYGSTLGDRISESTIEKDLWAMRNESELGFYAPIKFSKGEKGYFYEDPDYSIDSIPLNDDDVEAIKFAATTLFQFKDVEVFKQFEFAIEKIFDRLNITPNIEDKAINQFVQFETISQVKGAQFLGIILQAIKDRMELAFTYRTFTSQAEKEYTLQPYLLKEYRNRWYLIGYNATKDRVLTYALDRIGTLDVRQENFQVQESFDPDLFFKHSIGITSFQSDPVDVTLSFTPIQGKYVKTQPLHHSQTVLVDDDQEFRIRLHVLVTTELVMQILSYGGGARVLDPPELVNEIKQKLQESLQRYD